MSPNRLNKLIPLLLTLVGAMLFAPFPSTQNVIHAVQSDPDFSRAPAAVGDCFSAYLPNLSNGFSGAKSAENGLRNPRAGLALAGPNITITNPQPGWTISAVSNFTVQPSSVSDVQSVTFTAGGVDLGTDSTPGDGFSAFVDTSQFADGPLTLMATAFSNCGSTSQSIEVNVVKNLPTNGTVGEAGGALASEIGSVIIFPEEALEIDSNVTVTEKTQQEITDANGFEWDEMAVTFLGAQVVDTSSTLNQAPAMVASAGFSNRVQPGQAIVNYRIMPDADGDGVDELIVVNTASIGPSGFVVSNTPADTNVRDVAIGNGPTLRRQRGPNADFSGQPGEELRFNVDGSVGINGSIRVGAIFISLVEDIAVSTSLSVSAPSVPVGQGPGGRFQTEVRELFTIIPDIPVGNAILMLIDQDSGERIETYEIEILTDQIASESNQGDDPAQEMSTFLPKAQGQIDDLEAAAEEQLEGSESSQMSRDIDGMQGSFADFAERMEELVENSTNQQAALEALRSAARVANDWNRAPELSEPASLADQFQSMSELMVLIQAILSSLNGNGYEIDGGSSFGLAALQMALNSARLSLNAIVQCAPSNSTSTVNTPSQNTSQVITGMGSTVPTGGPACGALVSPSIPSAPLIRPPSQPSTDPSTPITRPPSLTDPEVEFPFNLPDTDQIVVKMYTSGVSQPFSAAADGSGYFFFPMVPEGETYTAVAINTDTGETRMQVGQGPPLDGAEILSFDFTREAEPVGTPITIGQTFAGSIAPDEGAQIYSFQANAGQTLFLDAVTESLSGFSRWTLTGPTGVDLAGGQGVGSDLGRVDLTESGQYLIFVTPDNNSTIDYELKVWDVPEPDVSAINFGQAVTSGNLETPGVADIYTFNGTAGQRIFIDSEFEIATLNFEANWTLTTPNGTVLLETVLLSDQGPIELPSTGEYTLKVEDETDVVGTYEFAVWDIPDPDMTTINFDQPITAGNIESPSVRDIYTFTGTVGQNLFFDSEYEISTLNFKADWTLMAPNGDVVFTAVTLSDQGPIELPQTGEYTLTVGEDSDVTGPYTFTVWEIPPAEMFEITFGQVISDSVPAAGAGNIEVPSARDIYTFAGTAGQVLFFDSEYEIATLNFKADWTLSAPNGDVVFTAVTLSDQGPIELPQTGEYTLTVGEDSDVTGSYTFTVWEILPAETFTISIGQAVSDGVPAAGAGNIEVPSARDIYTFAGTAGQSLLFDSEFEQSTVNFMVDWMLMAPNGDVLFSAVSLSDQGPIELSETGQFTLIVGEDSDITGTYEFVISHSP